MRLRIVLEGQVEEWNPARAKERLDEFTAKLHEFLRQEGGYWVDVYSALKPGLQDTYKTPSVKIASAKLAPEN